MTGHSAPPPRDAPNAAALASDRVSRTWRIGAPVAALVGLLVVVALTVWWTVLSGGSADPTVPSRRASTATIDIAVLVFREGLESVLVLAAITASMVGGSRPHRRPIAVGVGFGMVASMITWLLAVRLLQSLSDSVPALQLQSITGLLAIVVLLVVMNWFFHKVYWSGWISLHTNRKRSLLRASANREATRTRLFWGLVLLGFTSFYREGFEVVLFLQSYRLKLGPVPVARGVALGSLLAAGVAVLTFVAHRHLPYRKMLVATGVLLGVVLLVMVGEQAQEMQMAGWLPTTPLPALSRVIPAWAELWFAVFPTRETLLAQGIAAGVVLGSYAIVNLQLGRAYRTARDDARRAR